MTDKNHLKSFVNRTLMLALLIISYGIAAAQTPLPISKKAPYYINANAAGKAEVFEIHDGELNVQYEDKHGTWKEIILNVYNWKYEKVGTFAMDKTFGLNHYTLDLQTRLPKLEMNQNYFCSIKDETGSLYEWMFRNTPPAKRTDLQTDIYVNPVHVDCSKQTGNLAEFHSAIKNGVAPFTINWYVMDEGMNNLLYQPREEIVARKKKASMIQVDRAPGYYVILDVTDACGTNSRKMVYLDCEQLKKKVNTVFVQPIPAMQNVKRVKSN